MIARVKRLWTWTFRMFVAVVCFGACGPALAQQAVFGSVGTGMSVTPKANGPGIPLIGPGVGGNAAMIGADAGAWLSRWFGIAGELSLGLPFEVQQIQSGFGACCTQFTREHRLTYLSGVAKVRIRQNRKGFVIQGGLSALRISTNQVAVGIGTPFPGRAPGGPVQSSFSTTRAAWVAGTEIEYSVSGSLRLVPAARVHVNFPAEEISVPNPLALGNTTFRFTLSLRGTTGR